MLMIFFLVGGLFNCDGFKHIPFIKYNMYTFKSNILYLTRFFILYDLELHTTAL